MADVFEEVEEQIRSDRYKALALKALPWILGALLLALVVALGVWGWQEYRSRAVAQASEQYAAALDAFNEGRPDEAFRLWGEVADSPAKGYAALALMQQGAVRLDAGATQEAVQLFDQAAETAPDPLIGDAARLKSAFALMDTAPLQEVEARLRPMLEEDRPYRGLAREALAFAKLAAGDLAGARSDFVVLSLLAEAPEGARQRARAAIQLIDSGTAQNLPEVVRAARAQATVADQPQPPPPGDQ